MGIADELLAFSSSCPNWQRDLLRRISTQPELRESDIQEVLANLKSTEGLCKCGPEDYLTANHLANRTSAAHSQTILTSISDVKNANRLASGQVLPFAESGITLIYGYNGSGKTGYGRILKQACRSRQDKPDPILGDVYAASAPKPATATIAYKSGGSHQSITWQDGKPLPPELGRISVFDATTAPLYADRQNKIEFLPLGLDVLPRLARTCDDLASLITAEITTLSAKLSVALPKVTSHKFVQFLAGFGATSTPREVPSEQEMQSEFVWNAKDEDIVLSLEEEIRKISQPAKMSAQYERLKRSLNTIKAKMETAIAPFTAEVIERNYRALANAEATREAARLVAEGTRPQVIVFTHDLSFYYDLLVAASEAQIPLQRNWISKSATYGFGTVSVGDGPWQAKRVKERIAVLDQMIAEIPDPITWSPEEQHQHMESFYTKLRETWERLVEECLLNGVVGRFQPGVATQSLKGVNVTDDDYSKIFFAMKKASEYSGHDRATGRQPATRDKNDMKTDLDEIRAYERELKKRVTELEKARRTLEGPPPATITLPSKP